MKVYHVKLRAKACLTGKIGKAFALQSAAAGLSVLLGAAGYFLRLKTNGMPEKIWYAAGESALLFVSIWLLSALRQGGTAWFLRCAQGKQASVSPVLYWLRCTRSLKSRALFAAVRVRKVGWLVLLNMPCIALFGVWYYEWRSRTLTGLPAYIVPAGAALCGTVGTVFAFLLSQQYALGTVLLAADPGISVREAMRKSRVCMARNCGKLLRFKLSFLPWFLSCVFIAPIVYVAPYYRQSVVCRLNDILSAVSFGYERSEE